MMNNRKEDLMSAMSSEKRRLVEANLFSNARKAIESWDEFKWHNDQNGVCDTDVPHSSQALAIDVFGTLKVVSQQDRDAVLDSLAKKMGLPAGGPWSIELEWKDPKNHMKEKRKSQIDAVAKSPSCLIFVECKFTEDDGGPCSQPTKPKKGVLQCNGKYEFQTNPINKKNARCALSAKNIRYWEVIPTLFNYRNDEDYQPCPFAGPWYQWMRNLTCCWLIAQQERLTPAFVVTYADGPSLPMAEKIAGKKTEEWTTFTGKLRKDAICFHTTSYQQLLNTAEKAVQGAQGDVQVWQELKEWVENKATKVCISRRVRK